MMSQNMSISTVTEHDGKDDNTRPPQLKCFAQRTLQWQQSEGYLGQGEGPEGKVIQVINAG